MDKQDSRRKMLEKRMSLPEGQRRILSDHITAHLLESPFYKKNEHICIYEAFRGEVFCDKIKEQAFRDGKQVYIPVTDIHNHQLTFYQIKKDTPAKMGAYGILEPVVSPDSPVLKNPALVLMPGLAFDRKKHRIGYGGGYYDRYLADYPYHTTAALCFAFQVLEEELPVREHDILPDYIITEHEIF